MTLITSLHSGDLDVMGQHTHEKRVMLFEPLPTFSCFQSDWQASPKALLNEWCRQLRTILKDEFAKAFVRWQERCEKWIRVGKIRVENS